MKNTFFFINGDEIINFSLENFSISKRDLALIFFSSKPNFVNEEEDDDDIYEP